MNKYILVLLLINSCVQAVLLKNIGLHVAAVCSAALVGGRNGFAEWQKMEEQADAVDEAKKMGFIAYNARFGWKNETDPLADRDAVDENVVAAKWKDRRATMDDYWNSVQRLKEFDNDNCPSFVEKELRPYRRREPIEKRSELYAHIPINNSMWPFFLNEYENGMFMCPSFLKHVEKKHI